MSQRDYNYAHFTLGPEDDEAFSAFRRSRSGERAPDGELVDALTEEPVRISSLWRQRPVVLEFGSLT